MGLLERSAEAASRLRFLRTLEEECPVRNFEKKSLHFPRRNRTASDPSGDIAHGRYPVEHGANKIGDRKSTRLNSSH